MEKARIRRKQVKSKFPLLKGINKKKNVAKVNVQALMPSADK